MSIIKLVVACGLGAKIMDSERLVYNWSERYYTVLALSALQRRLKHEPSAQSPCANTMLGLVCLEFILKFLLEHGLKGERKHRLMRPAHAVLSDLAWFVNSSSKRCYR
jgi:hypothetical protein